MLGVIVLGHRHLTIRRDRDSSGKLNTLISETGVDLRVLAVNSAQQYGANILLLGS